MSPDNRFFSDLRRKAEERAAEKARQERLAQERRNQEQAAQRARELARQELARRKEIAEGVMQETDFPRLLDELRDLYHASGEGSMKIIKGVPEISRFWSDGYGYTTTSTTHITWENPYVPHKDGYVLSALWSPDSSRSERALFIEALPDGTVSVSGSGKKTLRESQWRGNLNLQAQTLEDAYHHYLNIKTKIKIDNRSYSTGESGGGAGS